MDKGDRVKLFLDKKHGVCVGTIIKITKDGYIVVKWDNLNGDWHWTPEQAKKMEVINEDR